MEQHAKQALDGFYSDLLRQNRAALLSGGVGDPYLACAAADDRMALSLLFRPTAEIAARIAAYTDRLRRTEPELYYYPPQDLHVTVVDILKGQAGRTIPREIRRYIQCLEACGRQIGPFTVEFDGMTASDSVIMAKGFYADGLPELRAAVRQALAAQALPLEERYQTVSAHISVARVPHRLQAPQALLDRLAAPVLFGSMQVDALELTFHNWYDSQKTVLAHIRLGG